MNKKRIGALLIGATLLVGALGSFAYFNGKSSAINGNGGGPLKALSITNGMISVEGKVATSGENATDWSYDVVKYSLEEGTDRNEEFINKHRSPDISLVDNQQKSTVEDEAYQISRAQIGAKLSNVISNARPGDAIVLGYNDGKAVTEGIKVENKSNLTVKIQLVIKNDTNSKAQWDKIRAAGWKMYVGGEEVAFTTVDDTTTEDNEIIIDLGVVGPNGTTDSNNVNEVEGVNKLADVRFELPLKTGNQHQGNDTNGNNGEITSLDLSQLIEIQATQENNGGWNEDGTGDRITK